jgi:argininosuccinate lyase
VKGLPLTYNRDLQEDKPPVLDSFEELSICLEVLAGTLSGAAVNEQACAKAVSDPLLLATDLADYLVAKGVPFREAHHVVGELVALAETKQVPLDKLEDADVTPIHDALSADWRDVFNLETAFAAREKTGMPGPSQIAAQIARCRAALEE